MGFLDQQKSWPVPLISKIDTLSPFQLENDTKIQDALESWDR